MAGNDVYLWPVPSDPDPDDVRLRDPTTPGSPPGGGDDFIEPVLAEQAEPAEGNDDDSGLTLPDPPDEAPVVIAADIIEPVLAIDAEIDDEPSGTTSAGLIEDDAPASAIAPAADEGDDDDQAGHIEPAPVVAVLVANFDGIVVEATPVDDDEPDDRGLTFAALVEDAIDASFDGVVIDGLIADNDEEADQGLVWPGAPEDAAEEFAGVIIGAAANDDEEADDAGLTIWGEIEDSAPVDTTFDGVSLEADNVEDPPQDEGQFLSDLIEGDIVPPVEAAEPVTTAGQFFGIYGPQTGPRRKKRLVPDVPEPSAVHGPINADVVAARSAVDSAMAEVAAAQAAVIAARADTTRANERASALTRALMAARTADERTAALADIQAAIIAAEDELLRQEMDDEDVLLLLSA